MSEVPDDVIAMRERLRARPVGSSDDPVLPERLLQLLDGELPADEAEALADRVAQDPALALELRIAAEIRRERDAAVAVESEPRRSRSSYIWTTVAALAAALAVWWWTRPPTLEHPGTDEIRAGAVDPQIRSLIGEGGLPRAAFELRWEGGPPGATFDVFVTTPELESIDQAHDLVEPQFRVPASALDGLAPGSLVLWRVTATTHDGRSASSVAFETIVQ